MKLFSLWVEAESARAPLSSKQSVRDLCEFAECHDFKRLYVQVFRRGWRWFGGNCGEARSAEDTLSELIAAAHHRRIEIHAWVNAFNLGIAPNRDLVRAMGSPSVLIDSLGRSLEDYSSLGFPGSGADREYFAVDTPGVWLDPASEPVRSMLAGLCENLVASYPTLSGIHLDFIRYPYLVPIKPGSGVRIGADFGYSLESRQRFITAFGRDPFVDEHGQIRLDGERSALAWDTFRRNAVTSLLQALSTIRRPTLRLSVAALAWPDRAYLSAFQDWRTWLQRELVDDVLLMSYTADLTLFRHLARQAVAFQTPRSRVLVGIGAYKLESRQEFQLQREAASEAGADGAVIFSYGTLKPDMIARTQK